MRVTRNLRFVIALAEFAALVFISIGSASAELKLASPFTDHMVLAARAAGAGLGQGRCQRQSDGFLCRPNENRHGGRRRQMESCA